MRLYLFCWQWIRLVEFSCVPFSPFPHFSVPGPRSTLTFNLPPPLTLFLFTLVSLS